MMNGRPHIVKLESSARPRSNALIVQVHPSEKIQYTSAEGKNGRRESERCGLGEG